MSDLLGRASRQRKQIEGQGIQEFQTSVTSGISEDFLRWKGINATLELARSPNSKIVIIGAGEDGLPLILGNMDTPTPLPASPASPVGRVDETDIGHSLTDTQGREPEWAVDKP